MGVTHTNIMWMIILFGTMGKNVRILIDVYMLFLDVCEKTKYQKCPVNYMHIYPTPPLGEDMTQGQF